MVLLLLPLYLAEAAAKLIDGMNWTAPCIGAGGFENSGTSLEDVGGSNVVALCLEYSPVNDMC